MAEEKQKSSLESLGRAWSERVKDIRQMAKKGGVKAAAGDSSDLGPEGASELLPDSELFAKPVQEDLSVQQMFAGDEDFYNSMKGAATGAAPAPSAAEPVPAEGRHFPRIPQGLVGGVTAAALVVLCYAAWSAYSSRRVDRVPAATVSQPAEAVVSQQTEAVEPKVAPRVETVKPQVAQRAEAAEPKAERPLPAPKAEPVRAAKRPVSLKIAQDLYQQADYGNAAATYEQLLQILPVSAEEDMLADFCRLKMAMCMELAADYERSGALFKTVSQSRSPLIQVTAYYHLCRLEMQKRQYLAARARAYQAIALIDAVDFEKKWSRPLRRNCYFLAAEAISKEALSLSDADAADDRDLPSQLWAYLDAENELLAGVDEARLRAVLKEGAELLSQASLGPKIQDDAVGADAPRSWTVTCNGASIDELMARFASHAGQDVRWVLDSNKIDVRNQSVSMFLPGVNELQMITVAAGCAGLLAAVDEGNVITIRNPAEYAVVSEQISSLSTEAMSCWQKFLLTFHEDPYLANVHFVLGLLKAQQGRVDESVAEYKMVVNRFSRSPVAPAALFNSARLKTSLQDYSGAYDDLRGLVEQYPDSGKVNQAYLSLAETAVKMGQDAEAVKLYCKVFNFNVSRASQSATALAAGKIFYKMEDFASAEKWLTQYINLEENTKNRDLYDGYFLLGRSRQALGKYPAADKVLRRALAGQLSQDDYREVLSALVEGYIQQQSYVEAFDLLNGASFPQFSEKDFVGILILKSRVLRAMGLADKALALLGDRQEYMTDNVLKTEIGYELSECYSEKEDWELAYQKLAQTLESADAGPMAHKTAMRLAEVCLRLDRDSQAVSVCSQLLNAQPPEPVKQKTLELLAAGYQKQKNYDRAALALLGQWQ